MVELQNIKKVKFQLDEMTQLRATAGLSIGMTIGFIATFILIVTSNMVLWYKIFGGLGTLCIIGTQIMAAAVSIIKINNTKKAAEAFANLQKAHAEQEQANNKPKEVSYIQ